MTYRILDFFEKPLVPLLLLLLPAVLIPAGPAQIDLVWDTDGRMLSLATYAVIYAIVGYGLAILMRFAGLPSVVHGALWGAGAYAAAITTNNYGWSFWVTLPLAALVPAVLALAVGFPALRTSGLAFIIVTLALGDFLVLVATNWRELTNGPIGLILFRAPDSLGPLEFKSPVHAYYLMLAFLYVAIGLVWLISRSAFGRRLSAIRDNEDLARSLGLNSFVYKLAVFVLSAAVVGIAGQLYLYHQQAIQPNLFQSFAFINVLLIVVMGGTNVLAGPAVGAWIVQFLPEWLGPIGLNDPNRQRIVYGVLLVAFMLGAPSGVVGSLKALYQRIKMRLVGAPPRNTGVPALAVDGPSGYNGHDASARATAAAEPLAVSRNSDPSPPRPQVPDEARESILVVEDLKRYFGAVRAVDGVSFELRRGEVLGIIGPNGSGKSTLFNCVSGYLPATAGRVVYRDRDMTHWPMDRIARHGLVRTFQHPMLFRSQTAGSSIQLALDISTSVGHRETCDLVIPRDVDSLLAFCGLADVAAVPVQALSYGHSRRLGVALALVTSPHVLMLDEPAAGLNQLESASLGALLLKARDAGLTLVVVDHDMPFLMPICGRIMVLDAGSKICEGTPAEVRNDPRVVTVYLGERFVERARAHLMAGD